MSDLQIFNFNSNPVRVELFDNQPHFCCFVIYFDNSANIYL